MLTVQFPISDTWCQYQSDKINGTKHYKSTGALPIDVRSAILPVYNDLTKPEILKKCLHGKTQNVNKSFYAVIQERIPKTHYVGLTKLELGVYDAIATFNDGRKATLDIFRLLKVEPGYHTTRMCINSRQFLMFFLFELLWIFNHLHFSNFLCSFLFFVLPTLDGLYFWQFSIRSYETFSEGQHSISYNLSFS